MEIFNNYLVQLGSVGILICGLLIVTRYLVSYNLKQLKEKDIEVRELHESFREHLQGTEKHLLEIITENSRSYGELAKSNQLIAEAFQQNSQNIKELTNVIKTKCEKNY